ncbi:MAG: YqeG family HAD IIIA-type phosphatase [Lachnospiraceae bacterium]|nr:YqeG family HAD IIIA-type phosphatase [Lachnospiraceae bacterium]
MREDKVKVLAGAGLLSAAAIWGFAFVVVKNSLDVIPPGYMLAIRFTIAAVMLAALCWKRLRNLKRGTVWSGAVLGFWLFASYLLQTIGCQYTTAGKNAFLTSAYVIIVPFLYWVLAGRRPDAYCITAAVLAVTGIGLLSLQGDLSMNVGDMLTLVCAMGFALHMVYIDKYTQSWDPVVLTALQLAFAALFSWIVSPVLDGGFPSGAFGRDMIISMLYLGIFSTMIGFLLQNVCQKYTSPDMASLLLSTEAVFGAVFSILLLGERMNSRMLAGCVLLFAAVILAETKLSFLSKGAEAFFPDDYMDSAYEIDFEKLYREGYRGLLFDIDNTLVPHGKPADSRAVRLFEQLREIGFKSCFLSNNQKERVESFNDSIGESFIEDAHKPSAVNYNRAMEYLGTDTSNTLFIGDQIFTDIYGAKRAGIRNILVKPIHPKEEIQIVLKRHLEKIVLHFYEKRRGDNIR